MDHRGAPRVPRALHGATICLPFGQMRPNGAKMGNLWECFWQWGDLPKHKSKRAPKGQNRVARGNAPGSGAAPNHKFLPPWKGKIALARWLGNPQPTTPMPRKLAKFIAALQAA